MTKEPTTRQQCSKCKYFSPARNAAGNILRAAEGQCNFEVVFPIFPILPASYGYRKDDWPVKNDVWPDWGSKCKCFETKK